MLIALQPVSGESVMTAAVHHCTLNLGLSSPSQHLASPRSCSGRISSYSCTGGRSLLPPAWCSLVPGVVMCRLQAAGYHPLMLCSCPQFWVVPPGLQAASTAVLQHCSQPDTLSAALGQSKRPATVIEEFSKLRNMAIITAAVLFIQSSDIDSSYALYLSSTPKLTPRLQLLFVAFYGSLLYRK